MTTHNAPRDVFGDVRALLQQAPAPQTWTALCSMVEQCDPSQWSAQLRPYMLDHLRMWPPHLRVTPSPWVKQMLKGHDVAAASLCTHLNLAGQDVAHQHVEHLERSSLQASTLSVLTLDNTWSSPEALQRLYTSELLHHVEHAHLSVEESLDTSDIYASTSDMDSRAIKTTFHALTKHLPLKSLMGLDVYADFGSDTYLKSANTEKLEALHVKLQHNTVPHTLSQVTLPSLHTLGLSLYQGWQASAMTEEKLDALIHAPYMPQLERLYLMSFAPQLWQMLERVPWDALKQVCIVHFARGSTEQIQGFQKLTPEHEARLRALAPGVQVDTLEDISPTLTWPELRALTPALRL